MKKLASLLFLLFFIILGAFSAPHVFAQTKLKEGDACRANGPFNLDRPWCWDACPGGTYKQLGGGYAFCTSTPNEDCNVAGIVTTNADKTFNLGVSVSTAQLVPNKTYEIVLDSGIGRKQQQFSVLPNTGAIQLGIGPLDTGYNGNTYDLYVRYQIRGAECPLGEANAHSCQVGGCTTQVFFDPKAPSSKTTNPLAPVPLQPGRTIQKCTIGGKSGIQTAIGCIPTDPSAFIGRLLTIGIGLAGGIAFLLILFGGFQILTSAGNPEQLNAGKELVSSAIAGLLLIIFSIFILKVIGVNILGIPEFK